MMYSTNIAAAILLIATTAEAFVPVSQSSFVVRHEAPTSSSMMLLPPKSMMPLSSSSSSPTALQMNLLDRFVRVSKGNLNQVLMSLEKPEKIMNQAVDDMQKDLIKIRQSYAEITASQRRLEKQRDVAEKVAQDWYDRAQLALRKGEELLAKAALTRRQEQLDIFKNLVSQMDTQGIAQDKLYDGMLALEGKINEAKQKKQQYIARAKAAESTAKVNDMLSGMTGKTSMDAFKRMEDKVEALEAAAEASAEAVNLLPGGSGSTLENEFLLLEGSASVDAELEQMKTMLLGPSKSETKSSSSRSSKSSADPELEKIKRQYRKVPMQPFD